MEGQQVLEWKGWRSWRGQILVLCLLKILCWLQDRAWVGGRNPLPPPHPAQGKEMVKKGFRAMRGRLGW